ncbi:hypothetical protein [Streptomyces atratus]|nr:hypothetical protein [Streptomyces atratus]
MIHQLLPLPLPLPLPGLDEIQRLVTPAQVRRAGDPGPLRSI